MAETAVSLVFDRLEKLLRGEVKIFKGVHDEVKRINDDLKLINSFLKDAENKAEAAETNNSRTSSSSSFAKTWVVEVRELAFLMEDVVDHYLLKVVERRQRHGAFGAVTKVKEKLKTTTHRHDISHKIREIETTMGRLSKRREELGFKQSTINANENQRRFDRRLGAHFVEESHLVGIERDQKVMTEWLLGRESKLSVMVVVGPGGIGKTTIVKNVYTKHKEMESFQCYAWITVSHLQDEFMLLKAIIENIHAERPNPNATVALKSNEEESFTSQVRQHLMGKRYLIVLDDVRQSHYWGVLEHAMVDNNKSSRVIITTRGEGVADFCRGVTNANVHVHELKRLSPHDALELFHRKTFRREGFPEELNALSKEFVSICNGVPLAIVAIAGLLSTKKKTETEWRKVHSQLGSLLQNDDHFLVVQQVISENYHALPSHLERCLLYFGLFPEGYSISCMRLIRLWVAEDFVKEQEGENTQIILEEQAEVYLIELFRRGLVQFSRVDFDGRPKSCHVDHLMHKFIVKKCKEQSFSQVMMNDEITRSTSKLDSVGRRLTILAKNNGSVAMSSPEEWKRVRSCFVFDDANKWPIRDPFFSSFELLARLDLSDARLDGLPEDVGELLNLRYLSLRNTNIRSLPRSIGKLENLQTLDLKRTQVPELPEEIKNLIKLRHLLAYYINNQHFGLDRLEGVKLKAGLHNLTSLLKLSFLDATNSSSLIKQLAELKKLRKLGIIKLRKQDGEALCKAIEGMTHLCSLSIGAMMSTEILMLQSLSNPPQNLQRLYLYGRLERFPNWIPKLNNLIRLYLRWSGLSEDPLPYLNDLSKLLHLELYDTCEGQELHFKNARLGALKVLHIESMPELKTIKIDEGALSSLEKIKIGKCPKMVQFPRDLRNLTILKALHLYDMPDQFVNRITEPGGEDYWIVNKIPVVLYAKDDHFVNLHNSDH